MLGFADSWIRVYFRLVTSSFGMLLKENHLAISWFVGHVYILSLWTEIRNL